MLLRLRAVPKGNLFWKPCFMKLLFYCASFYLLSLHGLLTFPASAEINIDFWFWHRKVVSGCCEKIRCSHWAYVGGHLGKMNCCRRDKLQSLQGYFPLKTETTLTTRLLPIFGIGCSRCSLSLHRNSYHFPQVLDFVLKDLVHWDPVN